MTDFGGKLIIHVHILFRFWVGHYSGDAWASLHVYVCVHVYIIHVHVAKGTHITCTVHVYTVEPVYSGHSGDHQVFVIER